MIDSDRRPLLKSASTDVVISNQSNFRIFSNRRPFQTLISIGPFTRSKFAIKNNCNGSFVFLICFLCVCVCFLSIFPFFNIKVSVRVRVRFRARVSIRIKVRVRVRVR